MTKSNASLSLMLGSGETGPFSRTTVVGRVRMNVTARQETPPHHGPPCLEVFPAWKLQDRDACKSVQLQGGTGGSQFCRQEAGVRETHNHVLLRCLFLVWRTFEITGTFLSPSGHDSGAWSGRNSTATKSQPAQAGLERWPTGWSTC